MRKRISQAHVERLSPGRYRSAHQAIPAVIRRSRLMERGGFDVFEGLVDNSLRRALLNEALTLLPFAGQCEVRIADGEQVRGGRPRRRFTNGQGGALQKSFYEAPWVLDFLRGLTNSTLKGTGALGTYSYYVKPGDYLEIHRDVVDCDVAAITCLSDLAKPESDGGQLCLYPERLFEPLSEIRATPDHGAVRVRVGLGQTIVMYGGIVPHALLPVDQGQARIVSVLCYKAV
jgi:hypothetical protein